jgi:hypothetical protein
MKFAVSTLFIALASLSAAAPALVPETDAASTPSALTVRAGNWWSVRDVSQIALDRLDHTGGALNNLEAELIAVGYGNLVDDLRYHFQRLNEKLNDINAAARDRVGP